MNNYKFLDYEKWNEALEKPDWYLTIYDDFKNLKKKAKEGSKEEKVRIKEEVYSFVENNLENNNIPLGSDGKDWDDERKSVNKIVIHHTKNDNLSLSKLNAMHLIRLYAEYYTNPTYEFDKNVKGNPIYSGHFKNDKQVFFAYHWLVNEDGSRKRLLKDNYIGWHSGDWDMNCESVAICFNNDLTNSKPSPKSLESAAEIVKNNYSNIVKSNVFGHREINKKTGCPGNYFIKGWKDDFLNLLN